MCKKMILVFLILLPGLVGGVQAATAEWDGAGGPLWDTPGSWSLGYVPTPEDTARINVIPGPILTTDGGYVRNLQIGTTTGLEADLTVDGGTLGIGNWLNMGTGVDSKGTLYMNSGTLNIDVTFCVGSKGEGIVKMSQAAGTINCGASILIPRYDTGKGHIDLDGGTLTGSNLTMRSQEGSVGTMSVGGGTLITDGNDVPNIQGYIDNGWITAYNGKGTLHLDYNVTNKGKTTLKATHMLRPNPPDGGQTYPGMVELSWTLPDPCVPGQPVPVDVYFTDDLEALQMFTDPAAIQVVSKQNVTSVVVQTQPKTRYYWAVDTYVGDPNDPIFGPIFSLVADNSPPEVDAGANIVTWLQDGSRTGNLDATVTDDDAYTVQWTVVSEPNEGNAVIETATAEDASITLSAVGEYVLQLEAFDGEYTGSDTVTINVYNDSCEAAQSLPDYVPLVGDLNGDCKVDDVDMALLEENWLQDNSLTEEWFKVD